jgi:hypothetical protein
LLKEKIRPSLFAYMAGIRRSLAAFESMAVGSSEAVIVSGVSDHVHLLLTVPAAVALADIMRVLKAKSSGWLRRTSPMFAWQAGYAAFSVSESNAGEALHRRARGTSPQSRFRQGVLIAPEAP